MVLTLHILNGARHGARIALRSPGRYVVGSAESADVRIATEDDRYVSAQHALIEVEPDGCIIRSMASLNPLTVNGERVARRTLVDGDVVRVGLTRLSVERLLPVCSGCGASDAALIASAENDDGFAELYQVSRYAHASCLTPDPQFAGQRIGRFALLRKLGEGGFGVVWLVHDPATSRVWALKQLRTAADDGLVARFLREGRFLTEHTHPTIVRCVELGEASEVGIYLLCEYVEGQDLSRFLSENGRQAEAWTIDVMRQVLTALTFLHTRTGVIVHRDVKPANVLLHRPSPQSLNPRMKLADLGIARALEGPGSTRLTVGGVIGTPSFLAPEVWSADPYTPAADIYSVGVMAYRVLTGASPHDYTGPMDERFAYHVVTHDPVPVRRRLAGVSPLLAQAIDTACRRSPSERHPTADAFAEALLKARTGAR